MSVGEAVWEEITGRPLTAPHNLPRNPVQRDILTHLASTFVSSGYSLKAVIRATVLHPYYVQSSPSECATGYDVYYLPTLFDAWSPESLVTEMRRNSMGDQVSRLPARTLLKTISTALMWPEFPGFFPQEESESMDAIEQVKLPPMAAMQRDIGAFMTDGETGFRGSTFQESLAYEAAFGGCMPPDDWVDVESDYIDALVSAADGFLLRDAVASLKDRLLADPDLSSAEEREVLSALAGSDLDTPMRELPNPQQALRRVCTALISSPQFMLDGLSPEDRAGAPVPIQVDISHCERVAKLVAGASCVDGQLQL